MKLDLEALAREAGIFPSVTQPIVVYEADLADLTAYTNAVLEAAARECDAVTANATEWDSSYWDQAAGACGHRVRALKVTP